MKSSSLKCNNCKAGFMCSCTNVNRKSNNIKSMKKENVNHPTHYLKDSGHEVIEVIKAWKLNFSLGNAIKYIARAGKKDPSKTIEDLEKAKFYIDDQIKSIKNKNIT